MYFMLGHKSAILLLVFFFFSVTHSSVSLFSTFCRMNFQDLKTFLGSSLDLFAVFIWVLDRLHSGCCRYYNTQVITVFSVTLFYHFKWGVEILLLLRFLYPLRILSASLLNTISGGVIFFVSIIKYDLKMYFMALYFVNFYL